MKIKTKGICTKCNEMYDSSKARVHLNKCLLPTWIPSRSMKEGYLVKILCAEQPNIYWMFVALPKNSSLILLDTFLRDTWLECCYHLSCFTIGRQQYFSHTESGNPSKLMNKQLFQFLSPGCELDYTYDMGSSTDLKIQIIETITACPQKKVSLLMKNNPPNFLCESCRKEATNICSLCGNTICSICSKNHRCAVEENDTYMLMPLVNSPRAGICGYDGQ